MNFSCRVVDEVYEIYQSQIPHQALNERDRLSLRGVRNISNEDDERLYKIFESCNEKEDCEDCNIWRLYLGTLSIVDVPDEGISISGPDHIYEVRRGEMRPFFLADETRKIESKIRVDLVRV